MKKLTLLLTALVILTLFSNLVIADDEDIKNHIDERLREFKDSAVELIDERTSDVTTDLKTYVNERTDDIRRDLDRMSNTAIRKLIFGQVGSVIIVLSLWEYLKRLKDKKVRGLMDVRIVPNPNVLYKQSPAPINPNPKGGVKVGPK